MLKNLRHRRRGLKPWRNRKLFFSQELRVEHLGLITHPVVAEYGYDGMTGAEIAGEPDGACDIDAARTAKAQAFLGEQAENHVKRFRIGDLIGPVDCDAFEVRGD